jgi:hypothetical protein
MPLKNPITIEPGAIKAGDSFAVVLVCHVMEDGSLRYYRAPYPVAQHSEDGVPQGAFMGTHLDGLTVNQMFPTMSNHLLR